MESSVIELSKYRFDTARSDLEAAKALFAVSNTVPRSIVPTMRFFMHSGL